MQSKEDAIHIAIFAAVDLAALLANALLIAAILKRYRNTVINQLYELSGTLETLKSFSVLVLNMAMTDSVTSVVSLLLPGICDFFLYTIHIYFKLKIQAESRGQYGVLRLCWTLYVARSKVLQ